MRLPEIIGISGTNGAGKDTLAALRAEKEGALHVSLSDILRKQLIEDNIALEREALMALSRRWREEAGDYGVLATKTIRHYLGEKALYDHGGLSIVSVRHPEEVWRIKEAGGRVLWVDAHPTIRYERLQNSSRGRVDDDKTYEEFLQEEAREITPPTGSSSANVNLGAVRPLADEVIINDFKSENEYRDYLGERYDLL
jgi:dephospho-CoA kinase